MNAYKLLRVRKDGSLGPLFIHARQRIPVGEWLAAELHPTPGFSPRKGWHCSPLPRAPHLGTKGRAWFRVEIEEFHTFTRPKCQGGLWLIAQRMKVLSRHETLAAHRPQPR